MDPLTKLYSEKSAIRDQYFTAQANGSTQAQLDKINTRLEENLRDIDHLLNSGNTLLQNGSQYYPYRNSGSAN